MSYWWFWAAAQASRQATHASLLGSNPHGAAWETEGDYFSRNNSPKEASPLARVFVLRLLMEVPAYFLPYILFPSNPLADGMALSHVGLLHPQANRPRPTHFTFQSDFCKNLQLGQPLATSSEKQGDICPPKCCCNSFLWWPEPQSGNIGHLYSDEQNAIEFFSFLIQGNAELVTQPCHVSFRKLGAVFLEV